MGCSLLWDGSVVCLGYTLVYRYVVWRFACIIKLVVGLMDNVMDIAKYLIKIIK